MQTLVIDFIPYVTRDHKMAHVCQVTRRKDCISSYYQSFVLKRIINECFYVKMFSDEWYHYLAYYFVKDEIKDGLDSYSMYKKSNQNLNLNSCVLEVF